jgi:cytidyltransferase-like protein
MENIILISGSFDPVHKGHVRLFAAAKEMGHVIVGLNTDGHLIEKKGAPFMNFEERMEVLNAMRNIDEVWGFDDTDNTSEKFIKAVIDSYKGCDVRIIFVNGGDDTEENTYETEFCETNGVELKWGVGGDKIQSSAYLIKKIVDAKNNQNQFTTNENVFENS